MASAISSQMASNLANLMSVNSDLGATQNRIGTGKKVNTAADNAAVYFKALSFQSKSEDLGTVNADITQALSNVSVADKALTSMQKNLEGTLQQIRDARAKAVNAVLSVTTAGGQTYADAQQTGGANNQVLVRQRPAPGAAIADLNNAATFQEGDTFAMSIVDAQTGTTTTRFFRAASFTGDTTSNKAVTGEVGEQAYDAFGGAAVNAQGAAILTSGLTEQAALNFKDLATLKKAMVQAFGTDAITVNVTPQATGTNKISFALASSNLSASFSQITNNDPTAANAAGAVAANRGATFDFNQLFGTFGALTLNAAGVQVVTQQSATTGASSIANATGASYTYTGSSVAQQSVLEARRQAADAFRATIANLRSFVNDASLPGWNNLLKGEAMDVALNETREVRQTFSLAASNVFNPIGIRNNSVDPANYFAAVGISAAGVVTTANVNGNFATDADMDAVIAQSTTYLRSMRIAQSFLASQTTMLQSRKDFNAANISLLKQAVTDMTAVDMAEEATNLAALQNQQAFSTNNLAVTKQSEQSLIQLLR